MCDSCGSRRPPPLPVRCPGALTERYELYVGDVAKADEIEDESVDCIITDPPYPKEFLSVYAALS